jgi:hypothetical protein
MLERNNLKKFNGFRNRAEIAAGKHDYSSALEKFEKADTLAVAHDDDPRRLQTLTPSAQILWRAGQYDKAAEKLDIASKIVGSMGKDEQAMNISNLGRLITNRIIQTAPANRHPWLLNREALPRFEGSYLILRPHPNFYYRYENAQHGSLAAALGNDRGLAAILILEGLETAFRIPEKDSETKKPPFVLSPGGLIRLAGATALLPLGNHTPLLARFARSKLVS